jgi:formylglycine-generating enzyme required for sulfatase activity
MNTPRFLRPDAVTRADETPKPEKYALLIAVNKYNHAEMNRKPLAFAEADAKALAKLLQDSGYQVDLLLGSSAKQQAIRDKLAGLDRRGNGDGVVLIGLFGHGVEYERDQTAYYCPFDTRVRKVKVSKGRTVKGKDQQPLIEPEPESLIGMPELLTALRVSPAGNKVMLAECFCDSPNRPHGRAFGSGLKSQEIPENTALLFVCSENEQAFKKLARGRGAFTKVLLDEITALSQTSGQVKLVGTLADRIKPKVVKLVKSQDASKTQTPSSLISDTVALQLRPDLKKSFTNSIGMKFTLIPAGEFLMGSNDGKYDEHPVHRVRISRPFYMGVYEVTQAQYQRVMGRNPSAYSKSGYYKDKVFGLNTSDFPVDMVSWEDAQAFCRKLSALRAESGRRYRLPTEAEWEYACRAGTQTKFHFGDVLNGDKANVDAIHPCPILKLLEVENEDNANVDGTDPEGTATKGPYLGRPTSVGSYEANAFGLYDMHGNVQEWCEDVYVFEAYFKRSGLTVDPLVTSGSEYRVMRGGSFGGHPWHARSASRSYFHPAIRFLCGVGFRVVCE